jgi:hypothetical protein
MREERASGVGERALFDLRESEKTMHTTIARSGIAGCSVRERRKLCVVLGSRAATLRRIGKGMTA